MQERNETRRYGSILWLRVAYYIAVFQINECKEWISDAMPLVSIAGELPEREVSRILTFCGRNLHGRAYSFYPTAGDVVSRDAKLSLVTIFHKKD